MASHESLLAALLNEEVSRRSNEALAKQQLALSLLSSSSLPSTTNHCQLIGSVASAPDPLSSWQNKMAAALEIQQKISKQKQQEQLLLEYQLLTAAEERKRRQQQQQQQQLSLNLAFAGTTCNGGANDLLSPAILQQLPYGVGPKHPLENMIMAYSANKRMRFADEQSELPTVPCRCRGMPDDHNPKTAFIVIPEGVEHGQALMCSHPICQARGVRFRYCASCRRPVAKRNFSSRHSHHHPAPNKKDESDAENSRSSSPPPTSDNEEDDTVTSHS